MSACGPGSTRVSRASDRLLTMCVIPSRSLAANPRHGPRTLVWIVPTNRPVACTPLVSTISTTSPSRIGMSCEFGKIGVSLPRASRVSRMLCAVSTAPDGWLGRSARMEYNGTFRGSTVPRLERASRPKRASRNAGARCAAPRRDTRRRRRGASRALHRDCQGGRPCRRRTVRLD
jgi:hypothetical protein